jgi:hypothetical protein
MKRAEEWDWPPTRGRYRTVDVYQPSGWNSPGVRKAIDIYWRTIVTIVKALVAVPLSLIVVAACWMLWILLTLLISKA